MTVVQAKGLRGAQLMGTPVLYEQYRDYCWRDVFLTYAIFNKLAPEMPPAQWKIMDLVLRAAVEPQFVIDTELLTAHYNDVIADKEELMRAANADKDSLMSND